MRRRRATRFQAQRLPEAGALYDDVLARLAKLLKVSDRELKKVFEQAGVECLKYDDSVYRLAGLNPRPLRASPAMLQILDAGLKKTGGVLRNLTMSTAVSTEQQFLDAADLAYMQVSTGAMDYGSALRQGVKSLARDGVRIVQFAGRSDTLDAALLRTLRTGIGQTAGLLQMERAHEMGCDLVEVSAHAGARDTGVGAANHASWQGKVYSLSGRHPRYENFEEITGFGTGAGLLGYNCRHDYYPFFEGLDRPTYTKSELEAMNDQVVTVDGREMSIYEATQRQRAIERKIRLWKREAGALEAAGMDNTVELGRVRAYQAEMRSFVAQSGLARQGFREQAYNVGRVKKVSSALVISDDSRSGSLGTHADMNVSSVLNVPGGKILTDELTKTLELIDGIHTDGRLPQIPVKKGKGKNQLGCYRTLGNKSISITVSRFSQCPRMTFAHEIGHFLDHQGIALGGKFASTIPGSFMKEWRDAVHSSTAYKKLLEGKNKGLAVPVAGNDIEIIDKKLIQYLLQEEELWARSYSQFIAVKSNDTEMLAELSVLLEAEAPLQWNIDDFKPIQNAIENLFKGLKWIQ